MEENCFVTPESLKTQHCRVCLHKTSVTYKLGKELDKKFTEITEQLLEEESLPKRLCSHCLVMLKKCVRFKMKAQKAYRILNQNLMINIEEIENQNKEFKSHLTTVIFPPEHFDFKFNFETETPNLKTIKNITENVTKHSLNDLTKDGNINCRYSKNNLANFEFNSYSIIPIKSELEIDLKGNCSDDNYIISNDIDQNVTSESDIEKTYTNIITRSKLKEKCRKKTKTAKQKICDILKNNCNLKSHKSTKSDRFKGTKILKVQRTKGSKKIVQKNQDNELPVPKFRGVTSKRKDLDEYFDIKYLSVKEQVDEHNKKRGRDSFIKSQFKCEFCYEGFMRTVTFETHMAKHNDQLEYKCRICKLTYEDKRRLQSHSRLHADQFFCKKCDFKTKARSAALLHINWHKGVKYQCEQCAQEFERLSTLLTHVRLKHPTNKVCPLCGYSFLCDKGLQAHHKLMHRTISNQLPEDGPWCDECRLQFNSQQALETHLLVSGKHGKALRNSPRVSWKPKKDCKKKAEKHVKERLFDTPVPCEQCNAPMHSCMEYHHHFTRYHRAATRTWYPPESYTQLCDLCGKILKFGTMKAHMLEHENNRQFKCPKPECGKLFKGLINLKQHADSHGEMRFECTLCPKKFNRHNNLMRHKKYVHSDAKNYKCSLCDKHFKDESAKKLHVKHVHHRTPWPKRSRNKSERDADKRRCKGGTEMDVVPADTSQNVF